MKTIRIGAGAGFSGDRIEPAVELAEKGDLDYLVFECLAERTIALAQQAKMKDPTQGYDPLLDERMQAVLPACRANGIRIITNMGAANPLAAAERSAEVARSPGPARAEDRGRHRRRRARGGARRRLPLDETGQPVAALGDRLVSANAYLGAGPIVEALAAGADVVITGRAADPALFLAPLVHEFGWAMDDWTRLGRGTVVGHLLECAGQITGGYFADPGFKDVPDLARLGFPIAEVAEDGTAVITKVAGLRRAGDRRDLQGAAALRGPRPGALLQADVVADFSGVHGRRSSARTGSRRGRRRPGPDRHAEGFGRLPRRLRRRGPDLLCRPGRRGARPAGARDRRRAAAADRRGVPGAALRPDRRRRHPRPKLSAAAREPRGGARPGRRPHRQPRRRRPHRQRGRDAVHQRPRAAAAAPGSRRGRWSASARSCCPEHLVEPAVILSWRADMRRCARSPIPAPATRATPRTSR